MEIANMKVIRVLVVVAGFLLLPGVGTVQGASGPPPLPPNVPPANEAPDVTRAVNCDAGDTIQEAVDNSNPGDTVLVSGACSENVLVGVNKRNIVIDGQNTATVNGPDATNHTFRVRGQGITIRRFSSISGGRDGVHMTRGGSATVDGNTIENTGRFGVAVEENSNAGIVNNIIRNNPSDGILVEENSSARIGFLGFHDTSPRPNTIQNNERHGVNVNRSSSAIILSNTISGNTGNGVGVFRVSHADVGGNAMNSNGGNGIFVRENSGVNLGQPGVAFTVGANTTAANNTGFGLRCDINSYARGLRGTLNGTLVGNSNGGQTEFSVSCVNATTP